MKRDNGKEVMYVPRMSQELIGLHDMVVVVMKNKNEASRISYTCEVISSAVYSTDKTQVLSIDALPGTLCVVDW